MSHEIRDFQREVIEKSHELPVVADFWAEWCGPCRILGPVLEKLAAKAEGRWALAKVNTEEHQEVAQEYAISSIPAVKLFVDGEIADEFMGALPEPMVQKWLDNAIPSESDKQLAGAKELLARGDDKKALNILEALAGKDPGNQAVLVQLAIALVFSDPDRAVQLLAGKSIDPLHEECAECVRTLSNLLMMAKEGSTLPAGDESRAFSQGIQALTKKDFDVALGAFIQVMTDAPAYGEGIAKKACIAVFKYLGEESEVTKKHRPAFGRALYA